MEENQENYAEEELIELIVNKKISMHKMETHTTPEAAARIRRIAIERITKTKLDSIGSANIDYSAIQNKNTENVIGSVQIPVGVVGPILVNGKYAKGEHYVPMATTEGALVASVNRGMKAITLSGGANALVLKDLMTRAPIFEMDSINEVDKFIEWARENFHKIKETAESTTQNGKLKEVMPFVLGNNVWLRFAFETGDAMGMNMVTIATEAACEFIESGFKSARMITVSGNMCSDKKESAVNNLLGRGKTVLAESLIKENVLKESLNTTAHEINHANIKKNLLGSSRSGSTKFSGHSANVVAAIFAATGQDLAQVVESSSCYTWTEIRGKDLYISVTMPSLEIGTMGGGTNLNTQREALSIMGVAGTGSTKGHNALKFAEIVASAVLAGELNLLTAQYKREIGKAHKRLGRNIKHQN